jgi:hypothetical protein
VAHSWLKLCVRWSWDGKFFQLKVAMMMSCKLTMSAEWRQQSKLWSTILATCPLPRVCIWWGGYCWRGILGSIKFRCFFL